MKSPHKSPVGTSDNYQVMLTVVRKKTVCIRKANVQRGPCLWIYVYVSLELSFWTGVRAFQFCWKLLQIASCLWAIVLCP